METAVIRSQAQVVEENAEAGTGDGALPGVVDPRSVAPGTPGSCPVSSSSA
ncbi:hypothetical protein STAFG_0936 [Streptomyces afghaniensis 772]|uniref:Uncharacterized protein n=1 Tax=Streptomyces afghaniensis 772 TaxID=1283301 RepID=S4NU92_9ACTN|nr:hypothetical protein STAFG_0936 [Streptomyces afghaniensis 772]